MKSVALVVASLFTVTAFAAEPAKKDAKPAAATAAAPAKDAKPAAAPAKKEEKKETAKK